MCYTQEDPLPPNLFDCILEPMFGIKLVDQETKGIKLMVNILAI